MKKPNKSIICILVIVILVGCSNNSVFDKPTISGSAVSESEKPVIKVIDENYVINIIMPLPTNIIPAEDLVNRWETYILDKYGVDINLIYTKFNSEADVRKGIANKTGIDFTDIDKHINDADFVYLGNITNLKDLTDSGLILPVNEYLGNIPLINNLDDSIKYTFSDSDDNIWAFPLYHETFSSCLAYNGEWLEKWGHGAPVTTDEYLQLAEYINENDPYEKSKTYIQSFSYASVLSQFSGILKAFGCYSDSSRVIGFNPHLGQYENAVLSENFPQAIEFIKYLYDEQLIYDKGVTNQVYSEDEYKVVAARIGSDESKNFDSIIPGYYLKGSNNIKLIEIKTSPICFALLKGAEAVSEKMQIFISMILSDEDCFMDLYAGIKDEFYTEYDTYYSYKRIDDEGNDINRIAIMTRLEGTDQKPYYRGDNDETAEHAQFNVENTARMRDVEAFAETDLAYSRNLDMHSTEIKKLNNYIAQATNNLMKAIIIEGEDIEATIAEYRETVKYTTVQLDEINAGLWD
ncbi:MAG: extracellular solute-binding protein [Clostridiales bacterium]|nr:extracellular solute-binding protein [Clostridiales bacterium]